MSRRTLWIGIASVAAAALSLLLPYLPVYDPWGWLVWGRELSGLELATGEGMSWKPLPVLLAVPLAALGDAAPQGWLLLARSGWLAAPLLAAALAARLAGPWAGRWRWPGALLAGASVALTGDAFTPPLRQFSGGLSEPLLVALVLGAIWLALERRPRGALWLGVAAALLRPECWPFLAVWAWREAARTPGLRPHAVAGAVLIPLLWFVPDLLGAGDPLSGSQTARGDEIEPAEALEVLGRAATAPLAAAWLGVGLLLAERRSGDRAARVLLLGAAAWVGLVAAMAVGGYAGLPRFLAPATAVVAVVGGAGIARAGARAFASPGVGTRSLLGAAAIAALLLAATGVGLRAAEVPGDLRHGRDQARLIDGFFELADEVPTGHLLACGGRVRLANLLAPPTALAWKLGEPLASVRVNRRPRYGVALSTRPLAGGRVFARSGRWRATELPCFSSRR
ncbi:MAG: hypothetical protein WDZ46_03125 [Solirubrobacterales bacterium]